MKFACGNCNYRFESEQDKRGEECPYCGEPEVIAEPNAEELLKE